MTNNIEKYKHDAFMYIVISCFTILKKKKFKHTLYMILSQTYFIVIILLLNIVISI